MVLKNTADALAKSTKNLTFAPARLAATTVNGKSTRTEAAKITRTVTSPLGNALVTIPSVTAIALLLNSPDENESAAMRFGSALAAGVGTYLVIEFARTFMGALA